ncbi:MAG: 2-C-methyl-D-erythritol 4-phosphate cytidylyltransferase, partial [Planctomycetaceae bacterium]
RAESVRNAIRQLAPDVEYIAVHDAARPLLANRWIDEIFAAAEQHKAAIPGLRISSTVKRVAASGRITETVDRTGLVQAQTPQVFERGVLEKAFAICRNLATATDEASMVEAAGHPVQVIDGWPMNIKITTAEDFRLAELFVGALPKPASLGGLHPFGDELFR